MRTMPRCGKHNQKSDRFRQSLLDENDSVASQLEQIQQPEAVVQIDRPGAVPFIGAGSTATQNADKESYRLEKKRKNNAVQSARKRVREREAIHRLKSQVREIKENNLDVYRKNQILEELLNLATVSTSNFFPNEIHNDTVSHPIICESALPSLEHTTPIPPPWQIQLTNTFSGLQLPQVESKVPNIPKTCVQGPPMYKLNSAASLTRLDAAETPIDSTDQLITACGLNVQSMLSDNVQKSNPQPDHLSTLPPVLDIEVLYQNLLPTLLLLEAGVDPLPLLQQKISCHVNRINSLLQQEKVSTQQTNQIESKFSLIRRATAVSDVNSANSESTQVNLSQATLQSRKIEEQIKELAESMLQHWLQSKPGSSSNISLETSNDRKAQAKK